MMSLHHTDRRSDLSRKLLSILLAVVTITSVRVQAVSAEGVSAVSATTSVAALNDVIIQNGFKVPDRFDGEFKSAQDLPTKATRVVEMTAYTSSVGECDATPFITADGSHTKDGIIAANFLPFGTKVRIPDYFGDRVFEVHDRMNQRFPNRMDVWMQTKKDAFAFGVRHLRIEIL